MSEDERFKEIEKKFLEFLNVIKPIKWENWVKLFQLAEKNDIHITKPGFYSPIPTVSELTDTMFKKNENLHIDWNEKKQKKLLKKLQSYSQEFKQLLENGSYDLQGESFVLHDAPVYYSLIRHFKPRSIIEVGAGDSTRLAVMAAAKNPDTKITAIDPFVRELRKIDIPEPVNFIEKPVQSVPLSEFEQLSKNDILFIDSSHVSKVGSDVNFLYLEVLPILKPGVIVHIHDIFLPMPYSKMWLEEKLLFWNEQFLLHAFLIGNKNFEILLSNHFMSLYYPELLTEFFDTKLRPSGGSFWMRRHKNKWRIKPFT